MYKQGIYFYFLIVVNLSKIIHISQEAAASVAIMSSVVGSSSASRTMLLSNLLKNARFSNVKYPPNVNSLLFNSKIAGDTGEEEVESDDKYLFNYEFEEDIES